MQDGLMWIADCIKFTIFEGLIDWYQLDWIELGYVYFVFVIFYNTSNKFILVCLLTIGQLGRWWYWWSIYHATKSWACKIRIKNHYYIIIHFLEIVHYLTFRRKVCTYFEIGPGYIGWYISGITIYYSSLTMFRVVLIAVN